MAKPSLKVIKVHGAEKMHGGDVIQVGDLLFEYAGVSLLGVDCAEKLVIAAQADDVTDLVDVRVMRLGAVIDLLMPGRGLRFTVQSQLAKDGGQKLEILIIQPQASDVSAIGSDVLPAFKASDSPGKSLDERSQRILSQMTAKRRTEEATLEETLKRATDQNGKDKVTKSKAKDWKELSGKEKASTLGTLAFIVVSAYATMPDSGNDSPHSGSMAFTLCERAMKASLRTPATADFASMSASNVQHAGNGVYRVLSHVDAQNGFGAQIRTQYICSIEYRNGDWNIVSLDF
ncbi:hypothetical protein [Congregibacter litoralis]|uniref:Uncharacterized protein n=1 Tax=Congregibacter litoralis KT71 TaxID=314285 RepID=A4ACV3_9GAMM|nr:hypothetical protein [Congregibacter litoralis]EAQ96144.1 hypothetical protein KT71_18801 [Congregibacter litoralis KT71]